MIEYHISQTLQDALRGNNTTASADMWRAIADGQASASEILTWATHVAGRIVEEVIDADFDGANRRAGAALHAIGFFGPIDKNRGLRADIAYMKQGNPDISDSEIVKTLQLVDSHLDGLSLKNAVKKVYRERKK